MTVWNPDKFFAELPLFKDVPPARRPGLAWKAKRAVFGKGEFIFQEGEPADAAWWVAEGFVKIAKSAPTGRLVTMELLVAGDVFGPVGLMGLASYPANAVAVTKCAAVRLPASDLAAFVRDYPVFAQAVLAQVSQRLHRTHDLRALDAESAEKKIAAALLWLRRKTGDVIKVSRREIAEIAGVAPETAIRVVLSFKKKGWVSAPAGAVSVLAPDALLSLIDSE